MEAISANPNPKVEAIRHHYEVSNDFYRLLLGPSMTYSGAYWNEGEDRRATLEVAQDRRLDAFVDEARVAGAESVLDIGCGWGTMLRRVVDVHDVQRAVGVTLSRTQADWINAFGNPKVDVRVESWEDHAPDRPRSGHDRGSGRADPGLRGPRPAVTPGRRPTRGTCRKAVENLRRVGGRVAV